MGATVIDVPFVPAKVNCHAPNTFFTDAALSEWRKVYKSGALALPRFEKDANESLKLIAHLAGEGWDIFQSSFDSKSGEWHCVFARWDGAKESERHTAPTFQEAVAGDFLKCVSRWKEGE